MDVFHRHLPWVHYHSHAEYKELQKSIGSIQGLECLPHWCLVLQPVILPFQMHNMPSWFGTVWVQLQARKKKNSSCMFLYKALSHTCRTEDITSKQFFSGKWSVPDTSSPLPHKKKHAPLAVSAEKLGTPYVVRRRGHHGWCILDGRTKRTQRVGTLAMTLLPQASVKAAQQMGELWVVEWFVVEWELSFIEGGWI